MTATLYERLSLADRVHFAGAADYAARNCVMNCFYGQPEVEILDIFEMLILPRDQILRALHELVDSQEIAQIPDRTVPTFRRLDTWETT